MYKCYVLNEWVACFNLLLKTNFKAIKFSKFSQHASAPAYFVSFEYGGL